MPTPASDPLYCAVAFSVVGLLITVNAAPIMLALGRLQSEAPLKNAFDQFYLWGLYLRGSVDTLAFLANVWALSRLTAPGDSKSLDAPHIATERRNS
jgi:hypothetical protein